MMHKFQKILLATDFSLFADDIFLLAIQFPKMFDSKLFIFHVIISNERITRYATCHILTENNKVNNEITNILVPIKVSEYYKEAPELAMEFPSKVRARISLFNVLEVDPHIIFRQPAYQILKFINSDEPDLAIISVMDFLIKSVSYWDIVQKK